MNETPLTPIHRALKAKLVDFAGWLMPMQYTGVLDEYHAVRQGVGLFDVSHMGRISVAGDHGKNFCNGLAQMMLVGLLWVMLNTAWFARSREVS